MELNPEIIDRLDAIGVRSDADLQRWRDCAEEQGEFLFWGVLERAEQTSADYRLMFPRLLAIAAECRSIGAVGEAIVPGSAAWGHHHVLLESMRQFRQTPDGDSFCRPWPCRAAIIWTDRAALAAAAEAFGDTEAIILDKQGWLRWRSEDERGPVARGSGMPWFAVAHWTVEPARPKDEPELTPAQLEELRHRFAVPASSSCWTVKAGTWHDGLASRGSVKLWAWDGTRAKLVTLLSVSVS